jgi:hypothetical protein
VKVSPRRSITADWQAGMPAIAHHSPLAAVHTPAAHQIQHVRPTRILTHASENDSEARAPKCDFMPEPVTCVENNVPGSPSPSMDRLSACSSSSKGNRKVMALHPTHGSVREVANHSTSNHALHHQGKFGGGPGHLLQAARVWDHSVRYKSILIH